jgi:uncharacterized cupin superfamily protein
MAKIFNDSNIEYISKTKQIPEYFSSSANLSSLVNSRNLKFDIRIIEPGKYSYPYHSHRNSEELFVILEGEALLRTPKGIEPVKKGDIIFFEIGTTGAHQIHNNSINSCKYLDIRADLGMDVCDYPDSGKVNILPEMELYETKTQVGYFLGEENVKDKW